MVVLSVLPLSYRGGAWESERLTKVPKYNPLCSFSVKSAIDKKRGNMSSSINPKLSIRPKAAGFNGFCSKSVAHLDSS